MRTLPAGFATIVLVGNIVVIAIICEASGCTLDEMQTPFARKPYWVVMFGLWCSKLNLALLNIHVACRLSSQSIHMKCYTDLQAQTVGELVDWIDYPTRILMCSQLPQEANGRRSLPAVIGRASTCVTFRHIRVFYIYVCFDWSREREVNDLIDVDQGTGLGLANIVCPRVS